MNTTVIFIVGLFTMVLCLSFLMLTVREMRILVRQREAELQAEQSDRS